MRGSEAKAVAWRDCGWRTGLGTCFYDRVGEAGRLERLASRLACVVLVGPRNVGKSELARYTLTARMGLEPIHIDARRGVASRLGPPLARELAKKLVELLFERVGLRGIFEALRDASRLISDKVVLVDEFHLLGGDAVRELEALCKMLSFYPEYRGWRLVATASEGWVMASGIESRLHGYGAWVMLVEGLDEEHSRLLYSEYSELNGCDIDHGLYWALVGGLPGYLPELCSLERDELLDWINARVAELVRALVEAQEPGESLSRLVQDAHRLLVEGVAALDKRLLRLGEHLTRFNIAYPAPGLRFKPQLGVYALTLRAWVRGGGPPRAESVLEEAERGSGGATR